MKAKAILMQVLTTKVAIGNYHSILNKYLTLCFSKHHEDLSGASFIFNTNDGKHHNQANDEVVRL